MAKPVLGDSLKPSQKPVVDLKGKEKPEWSFSFKYFNQIKYFGLDRKVDTEWFVALIERLKELSRTELEYFFSNHTLRQNWRYHEINWESKNIPISRKDLNWLGKDIMENEEEFPMVQFQISLANGRVVGFWYETVFHLVLLDPLHNIQPSKRFDYKVDDCYPLSCRYTSMLKDIDDLKQTACSHGQDCTIHKRLNSIPTQMNNVNAVVAYLPEEDLEILDKQLETKSITEIIQAGLFYLSQS